MPKYRGPSKRKTHSVGAMPTTREEAQRRKIGCFMTGDKNPVCGHKGPIRTLSMRCTTCEKLGVYENMQVENKVR